MSEIISHKHKHEELLFEYAKLEYNNTNLMQEIKHRSTRTTGAQENLTELMQEVNELMKHDRISTEAKQWCEEEIRTNWSASA